MSMGQVGMGHANTYIIGLCTLAGVIVLATFVSLLACRVRSRAAEKMPLSLESSSEEGSFANMPRSWTAAYRQYGSSTYSVDTMDYSYPTYASTNHDGIYSTRLHVGHYDTSPSDSSNHEGIYSTILHVGDYNTSPYDPYKTFSA